MIEFFAHWHQIILNFNNLLSSPCWIAGGHLVHCVERLVQILVSIAEVATAS
jgi:hypothetical protein